MADSSSFIPNDNVSVDFLSQGAFGQPMGDLGKSFDVIRLARSPGLTSSVSVNSHVRNRTYYWFDNGWNYILDNNSTEINFDLGITLTLRHKSGSTVFKTISKTHTFSNVQAGIFQSPNFFPSQFGANTMRMDGSAGSLMDGIVSVTGIPQSVNREIIFTYGSNSDTTGFSTSDTSLNISQRSLSNWNSGAGDNGPNVTVFLIEPDPFPNDPELF